MPDKGYRTVTVAEPVYLKIKKKAEQEGKSITALSSQILACVIEADEKLARYAPFIEVIGFEGNRIILKDNKKDRILDVVLHEKELYCSLDESQDCSHVAFCHALPQVDRVLRPKW